MCFYLYIYTHIYTYIHPHKHTHTQTHARSSSHQPNVFHEPQTLLSKRLEPEKLVVVRCLNLCNPLSRL